MLVIRTLEVDGALLATYAPCQSRLSVAELPGPIVSTQSPDCEQTTWTCLSVLGGFLSRCRLHSKALLESCWVNQNPSYKVGCFPRTPTQSYHPGWRTNARERTPTWTNLLQGSKSYPLPISQKISMEIQRMEWNISFSSGELDYIHSK